MIGGGGLPKMEFDLYFMIIYMCIKYESNAIFFFQKIMNGAFVRDGQGGRTYARTAVILYMPPPLKMAGHKKKYPIVIKM